MKNPLKFVNKLLALGKPDRFAPKVIQICYSNSGLEYWTIWYVEKTAKTGQIIIDTYYIVGKYTSLAP